METNTIVLYFGSWLVAVSYSAQHRLQRKQCRVSVLSLLFLAFIQTTILTELANTSVILHLEQPSSDILVEMLTLLIIIT